MKDIYTEPFLSSWPTPLSFRDLRECFRGKKNIGHNLKTKRKSYFIKNPKDENLLRAFWNVLFTPLGFSA
ncbi:MAG: hypothetical protein HYT08_03730 [Candidatus Levybacteria bacterium]|nr:hypothetical protein [Candidatus Levybacteria bacterium]